MWRIDLNVTNQCDESIRHIEKSPMWRIDWPMWRIDWQCDESFDSSHWIFNARPCAPSVRGGPGSRNFELVDYCSSAGMGSALLWAYCNTSPVQRCHHRTSDTRTLDAIAQCTKCGIALLLLLTSTPATRSPSDLPVAVGLGTLQFSTIPWRVRGWGYYEYR